MPRSAWSVALETYHGASTIIRRILDWLLWIIDVFENNNNILFYNLFAEYKDGI
jgi:hypothetical protein